MALQKFFFADLCVAPAVASALEGYATIRGGTNWTINDVYLRHIDGALHPAADPRLFSLVAEALERDFSGDIAGQCGADINSGLGLRLGQVA